MRAAVQRTGRSTIFFALCLFLDFANPFAPGAWSFESEQAGDVASASHRPLGLPSFPTGAPLRHIDPVEPPNVTSPPPALSAVSEWVVLRRLEHPAASDPPPLAEDH